MAPKWKFIFLLFLLLSVTERKKNKEKCFEICGKMKSMSENVSHKRDKEWFMESIWIKKNGHTKKKERNMWNFSNFKSLRIKKRCLERREEKREWKKNGKKRMRNKKIIIFFRRRTMQRINFYNSELEIHRNRRRKCLKDKGVSTNDFIEIQRGRKKLRDFYRFHKKNENCDDFSTND